MLVVQTCAAEHLHAAALLPFQRRTFLELMSARSLQAEDTRMRRRLLGDTREPARDQSKLQTVTCCDCLNPTVFVDCLALTVSPQRHIQ